MYLFDYNWNCIHMHIRIYVCICICVYIYIYTDTSIHVYMFIYICTNTSMLATTLGPPTIVPQVFRPSLTEISGPPPVEGPTPDPKSPEPWLSDMVCGDPAMEFGIL